MIENDYNFCFCFCQSIHLYFSELVWDTTRNLVLATVGHDLTILQEAVLNKTI